jgi:thioredoxin reductase (NADPH)
MSMPNQSIVDARGAQMFPTLDASEVERLRRFGVIHCYGTGGALAKIGQVGRGLKSADRGGA